MSDSTVAVLERALQWACGRHAPLILASTTGRTAEKLLALFEKEKVPLIVVTHEGPGAPAGWRFDPNVREKLIECGTVVLSDEKAFFTRMAVWFAKTLGVRILTPRQALLEELLGEGGRVCLKIVQRVFRKDLIQRGGPVVAVAGRVSGADTALALQITGSRPLAIALLEIIALPNPADWPCR